MSSRHWEVKEGCGRYSTDQPISTRGNLLALKLMIDCNESKFAVFREEPTIMQVKSMVGTIIKY